MISYDNDFYSWTQERAELLKNGRFSELDIDNLIEEVEPMGRSEKRELESRLTILLLHLLKWKYQEVRRGKAGNYLLMNNGYRWMVTFRYCCGITLRGARHSVTSL